MMPYSKIYKGDNELERLYRGDTLVWSKNTMMPILAGVTDYFSSDVGLTSARWENQIDSGDDITWHGATGMAIQLDGSAGILGTAVSYGTFTSVYSATRTIYCLFKAPLLGQVYMNRHFIGSCGGDINNFRMGAWMSVATDQYGFYDHDKIGSDQWNIGLSSNVLCDSYHVVTITRIDGGSNILYVDGVQQSTIGNSVPYGDNWGVGLIVDDFGNIGESPSSLQQIHLIALANVAHSADKIAQNSAWLRQHFLGGI